MNLRDLEYLVALSEHRHFGRAAAACYVSQPTLSTQIKKLESDLGAPLIERGARGVLFTMAGEQVLARAKTVLAGTEEIRAIARYATDPRAGTLRLGVFPTLAPYLLPHVVPEIRRRLPDLRLLLVEERTAELTDMLHAGSVDAVVLATPVEDSFESLPLFREDFVLAVPSGHPLAATSGPVTTGALRGQDILLLAEGHCLREQALEVCSQVGAGERDGFRATSLETLRHMVAAGVGITLLPQLSVAPPVPQYDGIDLIPFADPAPYRDIALGWRRAGVHGGLMTELADILRTATQHGPRPLGE
ncbi:LysR substrate-binding domain-containing protein [Mobilicoccus caccae]|uniref:Probable hydrogen peroxide-inducible genes activator n=1 Tax=Mobilicoccus caccae TaxID=1859295 RepID=A0ABQ6IM66_9MICO|nr:LysR substrate-binding domain-containing protein [Mobilicoccus caccae]GMA38846.1 LysR family transcriptional regulator [Mobilicoccus caccae]